MFVDANCWIKNVFFSGPNLAIMTWKLFDKNTKANFSWITKTAGFFYQRERYGFVFDIEEWVCVCVFVFKREREREIVLCAICESLTLALATFDFFPEKGKRVIKRSLGATVWEHSHIRSLFLFLSFFRLSFFPSIPFDRAPVLCVSYFIRKSNYRVVKCRLTLIFN